MNWERFEESRSYCSRIEEYLLGVRNFVQLRSYEELTGNGKAAISIAE